MAKEKTPETEIETVSEAVPATEAEIETVPEAEA